MTQPDYIATLQLSDISEPSEPETSKKTPTYIESLPLSDISEPSMEATPSVPQAPKKAPKKRLFSKANLQDALEEMFGTSPTPKKQKTQEYDIVVISSDSESEGTTDWTYGSFYNVVFEEEVTHL